MKKQMMTFFSVMMLGLTMIAGGGFTGKIIYSMEYDLPEAFESQRSMLATEMTVYIGKGFARNEQNTAMGEQISIYNTKTEESTVLMNLMGQKIALSTEGGEKDRSSDTSVEVLEETKVIAGYECKKAILTMKSPEEGGEDIVTELFYTEDLPAEANYSFPGIDGYPLEYTIEAQGMTITYSAKEIVKEKVDKTKGEVPSGYQMMTYDEFLEMMGMGQ